MTARNDDDLMVRYLEGAASDDEVTLLEAKLLVDPGARREFARLAHVQALFIDLPPASAATPQPSAPQPRPLAVRPRPRRWWRQALVAAAAALVAVGILWSRQPPPMETPTITSLSDPVACERGHAQVPLQLGDRLLPGDRVTAPDSSSISLTWRDGTVAHLGAGGSIVLGGRHEPTLRLTTGLVHAIVAHAGRPVAPSSAEPFAIATADGLARDIGTDFQVRSDGDGTTVQVDDGLVVFANAAGQVTVPAGTIAWCAHGAAPHLKPAELPAPAPAPAAKPPPHADGDQFTITGTVTQVDTQRKSFTLVDDATGTPGEYRAFYAAGHPDAMLARILALHGGERLTVTCVEREGRRVVKMEPVRAAGK
jgi:ferric-dicitrate binding protein FerR (iron transport regulator)